MTPTHSPQDSYPRIGKRTARACDECRRLKIRCEFSEADMATPDVLKRCRGCSASEIDCTFTAPVHKRGPPKGYLSALEQRLNDAEALLGALICSKDPRAASLISDLSKDPLASSIINRVAKSEFGPTGRAERARSVVSRQFKQTETPVFSIDHNGHLVFTSPSNTWQDYLDMRLTLESKSRANHTLQHGAQDAMLPSPTNQSSLQNSSILGSPEATEAGLKDLHMRLCGMTSLIYRADFGGLMMMPSTEEINSWLTAEEMGVYQETSGMDQSDMCSNYASTSSPGGFAPSSDRGFIDPTASNSKEQQFETQYGALYDILGLDKKQWEV